MAREARFTTGSTMRHVAVMTATGAVGLMSLFLVDVANLFYISLLGQDALAAAIGFAGTVQFLMISTAIGLSIAATAVVSRAIGAKDDVAARRLAASSLVILVAVLAVVATVLWFLRRDALMLLGAEGATLDIAARFLGIVLPSLPLLGIGMVASGLLRSAGDARRSMYVTLSTGIIAAVFDPILIFVLELGIDGAAYASVLARIATATVGLWGAVRVHDLIGRIDLRAAVGDARQLMSIALPTVATQVSTPLGNAYLTRLVSEYGDSAVAGWAVTGRVSALAFAGIFTLSGAVGPILGQNLGAEFYPRIRRTYRDALMFAGAYVLVAWALLWLSSGLIARAFGLEGPGVQVLEAFTTYGAGAYLFAGALFVSNASFNTLGRPLWSTGFNWTRDAAMIPILGVIIGGALGASGPVVIQAVAATVVGTLAAVVGLRYVDRLDCAPKGKRGYDTPQPAFASGRSLLAARLVDEDVTAPLADRREKR